MDAGTKIAAIASGILVVAIISVLVSRNANTAGVISQAGSSFAQVLQVAVSPVANAGGASLLSSPLAQNNSWLSGGLYGTGIAGY